MKRMFMVLGVCLQAAAVCAAVPAEKEFINSIGMKFVRVERGSFKTGHSNTPLPWQILPEYRGRGLFDNLQNGDYDERPVHKVSITKPYYVGVYEVTNYQYELFDHAHRQLRGKKGRSKEDDEAVIFVNWYEARAFCKWLSDLEGLPCRLPTEAEWEYACRAGTTTAYYHGDIPPPRFGRDSGDNALTVGKTIPNAFGIYDMHGGVEEWCQDWYGPYTADSQNDPVGRICGDFKVTRGGSHSTDVYFLRSANRMGAIPADKHWLLGFRVVLGEVPQSQPLPEPAPKLHQQYVVHRDPAEATKGPDPDKPYFKGPRRYVNIDTQANGPVYGTHNHDPAIVGCPNGDLLAIWYTCVSESGRELAQAASRLTRGAENWQPASLFWNAPDRNDHAPALWRDERGRIYHFSGMAHAAGHHVMVMVMRTSDDSGANWSAPRIIVPEYSSKAMPSEPVFRAIDGSIVLISDWPNVEGYNASGLWISRDEGITWSSPGGVIRGIHAGAVQLKNGCLLGYGRPEAWVMPRSISCDMGRTFEYSDSIFPAVGGAQRSVLLRLQEGPLFLAGFADRGIEIVDRTGEKRSVYGLYAAISTDEGESWDNIRPVTDDGPGRQVECTDGGLFIMNGRNAEYRGYLSVCQSTDGLIHLISSRQHYAFNKKWLEIPAPSMTSLTLKVKPVTETFDGPDDFDGSGWVDYRSYVGGFNGKGQFTINSMTHHNGINRIVGAGSFEITLDIKNIRYNPVKDRVSEGLSIWLKDNRARFCSVSFKEDHIKLEVRDVETKLPLPDVRYREGFGWRWEQPQGRYPQPPKSLKLRLTWSEQSRRLRIFYGLNGAEPTTELPQSQSGIGFGKPFTESTAIYLLMSNGKIDLDHFRIQPIFLGK
ncbi:MAG: SUMF1/EgtB/PvdO family nonheme iron enzyme [Planctomycetota bacterium]|jgi:formylglycine-generating enzyme required for sulfatase activity